MWTNLEEEIRETFECLEGCFDRRYDGDGLSFRKRSERVRTYVRKLKPHAKRGPKAKGRRATCHEDRAHYAKGMCVGCYQRPRRVAWRKSKRAA